MNAECIPPRGLSTNNVVPLLKDISRPIGLGLQVGIEYGTLQRIEKEHPGDIERQMIEVINFWLKNFTSCSWGTLAKAIKTLGGHDLLADELNQMGNSQSTQLKKNTGKDIHALQP